MAPIAACGGHARGTRAALIGLLTEVKVHGGLSATEAGAGPLAGRRRGLRIAATCLEDFAMHENIDPEQLPVVFPVWTASQILGIGKNKQYELIADGEYPVRILEIGGRFRVSRYDLLEYLGAHPVGGDAA